MGLHCGPFYESFHRETFFKELQLLTRYHHRNILSLIAFSNDGYKPCLIYEYMANGSLAECLEGKVSLHIHASCDQSCSCCPTPLLEGGVSAVGLETEHSDTSGQCTSFPAHSEPPNQFGSWRHQEVKGLLH